MFLFLSSFVCGLMLNGFEFLSNLDNIEFVSYEM